MDGPLANGDPIQVLKHLVRHQRVGRYAIIEKIATGGMGYIFLADDPDLHRRVVLKFISPSLCRNDEGRTRFRQEAQAAARLNHPNIVQIYEVAEFNGLPYFVMEYVAGPSLSEVCREAPNRVRCVLEMGMQVCDALRVAHTAGVTHLDIKPSNILIGQDRRVRLADFGLAAIEGNEKLALSESSPGTVGYMSPEQLRGDSVDARSDIFSFGIVLYELLAGQRPFAGEYEAAIQYAVANDPVPPLRELCPDVSKDLQELIERMLAKDPGERPESMEEVREVLGRVASVESRPLDRRTGASALFRSPYLYWILPLIVITTVALYYQWFRKPLAQGPVRLTVLPLQNIGPPESDYVSAGITEAITMSLASFDGVRVISTGKSGWSRDSGLHARDIGEELSVEYLVEGSVNTEGTSNGSVMTIDVQLLRVDDDAYLWKQEYRPTAVQLPAVQSQIANDIASELNVLVSESHVSRLAQAPTSSPEAWDLFLRGNHYFNRTWSAEDIAIAIRLYRRAIALDSTFALAWAMLSRGYSSLYWEFSDRSEERCQSALRAAEKALNLQPDLAEGHEALGYCYYHCYLRFDAAISEFEAGLMFQPSSAGLYNALAAVQRREAHLAESVTHFKQALSLDPRSHLKAFDIALTYGMMRNYDSTHAYVDRTLKLAPDWVLANVYRAWLPIIENGDTGTAARYLAEAIDRVNLYHSPYYWWLARLLESNYRHILSVTRPGTDTAAYFIHRARIFRLIDSVAAAKSCADTARQLLTKKLRSRPEEPQYVSQMSLAMAHLGKCDDAIELGHRAVEYLPTSREAFDGPFLLINLAEVLVICERYDDAIKQLEVVLAIPGFVSPAYLKLDPLWKPLHGYPKFQALIAGTDSVTSEGH